MRDRPRLLLIVMLAIVLGFASAAAGFAVPALAQNDGTVKIHDGAASTADIASPEDANRTKVCTFHVHGISFTPGEQIQWWIDQQPPTGTANAVAKTALTSDENGNWYTSVVSLADGHYKLYWKAITDQDLNAKHKVFQVQCGTPAKGTISVTKYNDLDGNGHKEGNEPGLQGWAFHVTSGSTAVGTITTDADGVGLLDLDPGTYTVTEVAQDGWSSTEPTSGAYTSVAVVAGQTTDLVFGNHTVPTGSLRVFKYNDLDADGSRDLPNGTAGEPGLSGWTFTVQLMVEGSPSGSSKSLTTGSDPLGYSGSLALAAGSYRVCENTPLPTGWAITEPREGFCKTVTVSVEESTTVTFGDHYTPPLVPESGTLQVGKYNDTDRDGVRDGTEAGLAGWTFQVRLGTTLLSTLVTGPTGLAAISLAPGSYTVTEVMQTGWTSTDPGGAAPAKTAVVTAGQLTGVIFGNAMTIIIPATTQTQLAVLKYADTNANGVRDSGEGVLAGFTFTVRSSDGAIAQTITTDASGIATLTNLPLATYTVTESARDGWTNTDPGGNASKTFTFTSTNTSVALNFGNAQIRLPSTATDGTTGLTLTLLLISGMALMFAVARREARPF